MLTRFACQEGVRQLCGSCLHWGQITAAESGDAVPRTRCWPQVLSDAAVLKRQAREIEELRRVLAANGGGCARPLALRTGILRSSSRAPVPVQRRGLLPAGGMHRAGCCGTAES